MKTTDIRIDKAFIGSCTNSRIEDCGPQRPSCAPPQGRPFEALIVPGSGLIKRQAEQRASIVSSSTPASNGAGRMLDVPCHDDDRLRQGTLRFDFESQLRRTQGYGGART